VFTDGSAHRDFSVRKELGLIKPNEILALSTFSAPQELPIPWRGCSQAILLIGALRRSKLTHLPLRFMSFISMELTYQLDMAIMMFAASVALMVP
jgi:hypothetical protein